MSLTAQFHGSCPECQRPIVPGQQIVSDGEDGEWVHAACGELSATAPCACSRCFLVHALAQKGCDR